MNKKICVIAGVGPGNGAAFAQKFSAEGYHLVLLARNEAYIQSLASELQDVSFYCCDVTQPQQVKSAFDAIKADLGTINTLIYNAGSANFKNIEDTTVEEFEQSWNLNTKGCFVVCKQAIPEMIAAEQGNIIIIGTTGSLRGGAMSVAASSSKSAQRSLAQSMARHLGPKKVHVSYVVVDGAIKSEMAQRWMPDKPEDSFLNPEHIAQSVFALSQQLSTAWTFELDLRPYAEKW